MSRKKEACVTYLLRSEEDQAMHCSSVTSLKLIGGNTLASASRDGSVRRWSLSRGPPSLVSTMRGHTDWVTALAPLAPSYLASASSDSTVRLWQMKKGEGKKGGGGGGEGAAGGGNCVGVLNGHTDYAMALAYAKGKGVLASAGLGGELLVWDVMVGGVMADMSRGGEGPREIAGAKDSLYCVAMDEAASAVAAAGPECTVRLWDPRSGDKVCKLRGHTENVRALVMDAAGRICVSGSSDGTIRVWDLGQQRCVTTWSGDHSDSVWALALSENTKHVFSGGREGAVYAHELAGSRRSARLFVEEKPVLCLEHDASSNAIWVGSTSSSIHKWFCTPSFEEKDSSRRSSRSSSFIMSSPPLARSPLSRSRSDREKEEEGGGGKAAKVGAQVTPAVTIPGAPRIVRHLLLRDRRTVVTQNSDGLIEEWNITTGQRVQSHLKKDTPFDEAEEAYEKQLAVPSWCSLDTRRGRIAVRLEMPGCFGAEVYGGDLGGRFDVFDETKVNLGEHVLCALFSSLKDRGEGGSGETTKSAQNGNDGQQKQQAAQLIFEFERPAPLIQLEAAEGPSVLKVSSAFDSAERENIPNWVVNCVVNRTLPPREKQKLGFFLKPHEGSSLASFTSGKLNAPRMFRIYKVISYVVKGLKMEEEIKDEAEDAGKSVEEKDSKDSSAEGTPEKGSTQAANNNSKTASPFNHGLEILCNDEVLPIMMSLATVKQFIWRKGDDIELRYRMRGASPESPSHVGLMNRRGFSPLC